MEPLIRAAVDGQTQFEYKNGDQGITVDVGETKIWALYSRDKGNEGELLCALIWRWINGETVKVNRTRLMFEILFLATSENNRFNHYGQQMVRYIEVYCRANNYDLMAVAAVPVHGVAFWTANGFEMKHAAPSMVEADDDKKEEKKRDIFLANNMLVFDDTPLFAKYL